MSRIDPIVHANNRGVFLHGHVLPGTVVVRHRRPPCCAHTHHHARVRRLTCPAPPASIHRRCTPAACTRQTAAYSYAPRRWGLAPCAPFPSPHTPNLAPARRPQRAADHAGTEHDGAAGPFHFRRDSGCVVNRSGRSASRPPTPRPRRHIYAHVRAQCRSGGTPWRWATLCGTHPRKTPPTSRPSPTTFPPSVRGHAARRRATAVPGRRLNDARSGQGESRGPAPWRGNWSPGFPTCSTPPHCCKRAAHMCRWVGGPTMPAAPRSMGRAGAGCCSHAMPPSLPHPLLATRPSHPPSAAGHPPYYHQGGGG